jgi:hypothetical protein
MESPARELAGWDATRVVHPNLTVECANCYSRVEGCDIDAVVVAALKELLSRNCFVVDVAVELLDSIDDVAEVVRTHLALFVECFESRSAVPQESRLLEEPPLRSVVSNDDVDYDDFQGCAHMRLRLTAVDAEHFD